ncbi:MAG: M16 family metallopeptidase [Candidatus Krumholzibacteriia bacterium]
MSPKRTPRTAGASPAAPPPGAAQPSAAAAAAEGADVQSFEAAGVPALLRRNPANEIVAVRLYMRGGSSGLDARHAGAEVLYARAARRGTRGFSKERLNAELSRTGADLGAGAGEDYSVFHLRCVRRHFESVWKVFTDVVLHPLLEDAEVDVVRRQMLVEIRQRNDNPDGRLGELARELTYAGHPYEVNPAGTEAAVSALEPAMLFALARRRLRRSNLLLVAIGDLTREALEACTAAPLGDLQDSEDPPGAPPPLRFERADLRVEERELPTNYITGQFAAPSLADADYPATLLAMSVLRDRLFEEVRTKRNLSYAPAAGLGNNTANLGWIYVTAVDPVTTMKVMLDEMRRLRDEPLDAQELRNKVQVYITRYYLSNETNQAQASFLARYELLGGGWERSRGFVSRLEALTPRDVQQAARNVLRNIQYAYLGDPKAADPTVFVDP